MAHRTQRSRIESNTQRRRNSMSVEIRVPDLGESVVEATIANWLKKEGDAVRVGEAVVELETEKVNLEVAAEKDGVLQKITAQAGQDVKVGETIGVIDESASAAAPAKSENDADTSRPASQPETEAQPAASAPKA